jgi:hypothetical protein
MRPAPVLASILALLCLSRPAAPEDGQTLAEFLSKERYQQHLEAGADVQKAGREAAAAAQVGDVGTWRPKHEAYLRSITKYQTLTESLAVDVVALPTDFALHAMDALVFAKSVSTTGGDLVKTRLYVTALGRAVDRVPEGKKGEVLAALAKEYVAPYGK